MFSTLLAVIFAGNSSNARTSVYNQSLRLQMSAEIDSNVIVKIICCIAINRRRMNLQVYDFIPVDRKSFFRASNQDKEKKKNC